MTLALLRLYSVQAMLDLKATFSQSQVLCWNRSGTAFRALFKASLDALGLSALGFRPYSLNPWVNGETLIRGRWKNSSIARLYICDGLSLLPSLRMTWQSKHLVAQHSSIFINEQKMGMPCLARAGCLWLFHEPSCVLAKALPWAGSRRLYHESIKCQGALNFSIRYHDAIVMLAKPSCTAEKACLHEPNRYDMYTPIDITHTHTIYIYVFIYM